MPLRSMTQPSNKAQNPETSSRTMDKTVVLNMQVTTPKRGHKMAKTIPDFPVIWAHQHCSNKTQKVRVELVTNVMFSVGDVHSLCIL